jgi:hypothetical protein
MGDSTFGSHFRQAGAFVRTRDPKDCRRVIVELDANLVTAVSRYFESLHVHLPGSWLDKCCLISTAAKHSDSRIKWAVSQKSLA